jgi:hypothetical protein
MSTSRSKPRGAETRAQKPKPPPEDVAALLAPPPPDPGEGVYVLPELAVRLGDASEDEVAIFVDVTDVGLVDEGRAVATPRIDTDAARLYGQAADFFDAASPAQERRLIAVSKDMLRVAVWAALRGSQQYVAREAAKRSGETARDAGAAEALATREKALNRRTQLIVALRSLTRGEGTWATRIDGALGTIVEPKKLAKSLADLSKLGKKVLADRSAVLVERRKHSSLDKDWLAEVDALAGEVERLGTAAKAALVAGPVPQAEVDRWDGINLFLLEQFIHAFDAAHAEDPSIPRLVPIALRGYYSPRRSRAADPAEPPAAPPKSP